MLFVCCLFYVYSCLIFFSFIIWHFRLICFLIFHLLSFCLVIVIFYVCDFLTLLFQFGFPFFSCVWSCSVVFSYFVASRRATELLSSTEYSQSQLRDSGQLYFN